MNSPQPVREEAPSRLRRSVVVLMLVIVVSMALLAIYANAQRWSRNQIETVIVRPATSPSAPTP